MEETAERAKEKGDVAWQVEDYAGAVHWYTKAIGLDPDNSTGVLHACYSNRSAAYLKLNDFRAALLDATVCTTLKPSWSKGWSRKGNALFRLDRLEEAMAAFKKSLEIDPSNENIRTAMLAVQSAQARAAGVSAGRGGASGGGGGGSGGNGGSGGSMSASSFVRQFPGLTAQAALRMGAVLCAVWFLVPLLPLAGLAYKYMLLCSVACNVSAILRAQGPMRFSKQYGLEVLQMLEFATVLVNLIMMTQRPYFLVAIPILMTQSTQLLWYISCLLQGVSPGKLRLLDASLDKVMPAMLGSLGWSSKPVNARFAQLSAKVAQQTAMLDVLFGIALVLELVLPRRNVMLCFIYWQFLQMRFMMDRSGDLKAAFRTVDSRIMALTSHRFCPATLGKLYAKLKHFLASKVNPEQLRTQSRCSVM